MKPLKIPASFWQNQDWKKFREACGEKTFYIEAKGAKALLIEKSPHPLKFWKKKIWELQRGPFGDENFFKDLLKKIFREAKTQNNKNPFWNQIERIRIFPPLGKKNFWKETNLLSFLEKNLGLKKTNAPEIFPEHTLFLDLSLDEEEIFAQMKQKGRYNIRKAEKHNITIKEEKNPQKAIKNFWDILQETAKRDGFTPNKKIIYEKMIESYSAKNSQKNNFHSLLLSAQDETGEILASKIFLISGTMGIYYYGASSNKKREYMAPYLLQWEGIKWAKKNGAMQYDFLGLAPENDTNHQLASVSQFKTRFGGERIISDKGFDFWL